MPSALMISSASASRAEQRQPAVADVVAAGAVVEEAHDLEAELAVLEQLVGHHAPELAGAGDEHPLQPDPAFHRRSSASRTSSREAYVSRTLSTRNSAQTSREIS
jgi:hypothetical protein